MGPWTLAHVLRSAKPEFSVLSLHPSSKFTKGQSCRGQEDGDWAQPSLQTSQLDPEEANRGRNKAFLGFPKLDSVAHLHDSLDVPKTRESEYPTVISHKSEIGLGVLHAY